MASANCPDCRLSALNTAEVGPLRVALRFPVMETVAEPPGSRMPTFGTMVQTRPWVGGLGVSACVCRQKTTKKRVRAVDAN